MATLRPLSQFCIYTIAHGERLADAEAKGRPWSAVENKPWVTGYTLWREAQDDGMATPVVIADSRDCSRLLYWGVLTKVTLAGETTRYTVDRLRPIRGRRRTQELSLRSTGRKIAPHFIRPYAICKTPTFVR